MNYGYMMGAAGVIAAMHRQDVAANNLANIQTAGFKPDAVFTIPREAARKEDNLYTLPSNALLERLGAGVLMAPSRTGFAQGSLTKTRNPFDLAIQGDGFLTVSTGGGTAGAEEVRLTRDGRLTMDTRGRLVTVSNGHTVLDESGRPITLNPAESFEVTADGSITQNGSAVAKLGFVDVPNRGVLSKTGDNLYTMSASAASSKVPASGQIVQYAVEESAADPVRAMMAVQDATEMVTTTAKIMQIHDDLMNRAINTLGRVSA